MKNKVNVLGTEYSIEYKAYDDDPAFINMALTVIANRAHIRL